ncbi:hypothetical protein MMC34_006320 [Xylographa carneopallida]|nr:hypothetical protein [Xylographa carneopallida]
MLDYLSHPFAPDLRPFPLQGGHSLVLEEASLTSVQHVLNGPSPDANRLWSQCKEGVQYHQGFLLPGCQPLPHETSKLRLWPSTHRPLLRATSSQTSQEPAYFQGQGKAAVQRESSATTVHTASLQAECGPASNAQDWATSATTAIRLPLKTKPLKSLTSIWEAIVPEFRLGTVSACASSISLRLRRGTAVVQLDSDKEPRPLAASDTLAPFTTLRNDEERQKKAEYRRPGTYFVVAIPLSFVDLEEYRNTSNDPPERSPVVLGDSTQTVAANIALDTETVILGTFEEHPQAAAVWSLPASSNLAGRDYDKVSPQTPSFTSFPSNLDRSRASPSLLVDTPQLIATSSSRQEERLLRHYRNFVRRHLVQIRREKPGASTGDSGFGPDLFEQEASTFPPLRYALMALSSLSLAHNEGSPNVLALQYYQKALSPLQNNLRSEQDLASNGAFLTHFILLLYEIAAAEPLWATHLSHLDRIVHVRRNVYGMEPFPAILWWVFIIDTHALLCGIGRGTFVSNLIRNGHVPTSADMIQAPGLVEPSSHVPEEAPLMPSTLDFHRAVTLLAARLGLLASTLRSAASLRRSSGQIGVAQTSHPQWQQQVHEIQESLKQAWRTQVPLALSTGYQDGNLPGRIRGIYKHTYLLYRACLIYSHTSMWSTQRIDTDSVYPEEVTQCASEIIDVVNETVRRRQFEHGFVVFPLFLAGIATSSVVDKTLAHELMKAMEQESVGNNKRATRELLEAVYQAQNARQMAVGHSLDVDWIQVMTERKLHVINFGL